MTCIDGLRGYLAISVLCHHFIMWIQVSRLGGDWRNETGVALFDQLGKGAVGFFFMVTGLVFYRRVLAGLKKTSWAAVYITRVFRILPLLVASIIAVVVIAMTRTGQMIGRRDFAPLFSWITCRGEPGLAGYADAGRINAYVLWSLRLEWLFYFVVLPLSAGGRDLIRGRLPSIVIPIVLLSVSVAASTSNLRSPLLSYLMLFAVGMLAYEVRERVAFARWMQSRTATLIALMAFIPSLLLTSSPLTVALPAFAFLFTCIACGNSVFGLLSAAGAQVLGEVSFSLYLLHGLLLSVFFVEAAPLTDIVPTGVLPALLPVIAVAACLLSCLTYVCIERPFMRIGSRLASTLAGLRIRSRTSEVEIAP